MQLNREDVIETIRLLPASNLRDQKGKIHIEFKFYDRGYRETLTLGHDGDVYSVASDLLPRNNQTFPALSNAKKYLIQLLSKYIKVADNRELNILIGNLSLPKSKNKDQYFSFYAEPAVNDLVAVG